VGDMSDLEYWPREALVRVLDYCAAYPLAEFMFLTKSAKAYRTIYEEGRVYWPPNTIQGLTIERFDNDKIIDDAYSCSMWCERFFVSWEPMLGTATYKFPDAAEVVIVGALTGRKLVPVKKEWIDSARYYVPEDKLYFKKSIVGTLGNEWLRRQPCTIPTLK
jgi:protein gp37